MNIRWNDIRGLVQGEIDKKISTNQTSLNHPALVFPLNCCFSLSVSQNAVRMLDALTLQVAGICEDLDVSDLVQWALVPPVGGGQISAARSLQDDEDGSDQHPQPAEPEHHQQRPAGPHPAGEQEDQTTWRKTRQHGGRPGTWRKTRQHGGRPDNMDEDQTAWRKTRQHGAT